MKCHEEVSSLQPMIPPKCFDIFSDWGMLKRSRCVQINNKNKVTGQYSRSIYIIMFYIQHFKYRKLWLRNGWFLSNTG